MRALKAVIRATWAYVIVIVGVLVLTALCFAWAVASLPLNVLLPPATGRRVGRAGAMWVFRIFLGVMEALGAWRLELEELDALRGAGPLIVAPNHPCLLDAVLVVSRIPDAVCVMKVALLGNFLLGPAARLARYVRNDSLLRLVARASDELRLGGQLLIFPEGTRSSGDPIGPLTDAVGALSRRSGVPVQTVIIETDQRFLGKGWTFALRPHLPLSYRVRLGRRYDPPRDVRAFTAELERYFTRELATRTAAAEETSREPAVEDAQRLRG
ncbi:MAG TPA: lysophospholipid acyltransferase family protein [Usitatibacter sp.]|nr:lysophospholipid acyltransferase family protein [Usitatibacter sp.]